MINPLCALHQFHIQIPRSASNKCHVVVSVTQFYEPTPPTPENKKKKRLFAIGFAVYEVPHAMTRLSPQFVMEQVGIGEPGRARLEAHPPFPRVGATRTHLHSARQKLAYLPCKGMRFRPFLEA